MISSIYNQQSASSLDFSMRTSSGDEINLSAYKESQIDFQHHKQDGLEVTSLSLRQEYGYSFSYSGNGIDKQDRKEIDAALKEIKPLLNFLNPSEDFSLNDKNVSDKAMDINTLLPQTKDANHKNFMKDSLITMMDDMMKTFEANDEILQKAKEVFDALSKQMEGLMLYA